MLERREVSLKAQIITIDVKIKNVSEMVSQGPGARKTLMAIGGMKRGNSLRLSKSGSFRGSVVDTSN